MLAFDYNDRDKLIRSQSTSLGEAKQEFVEGSREPGNDNTKISCQEQSLNFNVTGWECGGKTHGYRRLRGF